MSYEEEDTCNQDLAWKPCLTFGMGCLDLVHMKEEEDTCHQDSTFGMGCLAYNRRTPEGSVGDNTPGTPR